MTKEEIIRMAREAGGLPDPMVFIAAYERFAALVAAAEREACAKVLDENAKQCGTLMRQVLESNAAAIRARGNT
jgi:hypothetical protein